MPNYDFAQLSAFDFEMLVHGLLGKEWRRRLEAFKSGRDRGIDLRYSCPQLEWSVIIQCKHYARSTFSKLRSHLKNDEMPKVRALTPDRYVLVTSLGLTPDNKEDIMRDCSPYIRATGDIIGNTELNQLLEAHPDIEQSNFKLWLTSKAVLDRVLHNAELCQTDFIVEKIIRKLPLYVQNDCYPRAVEILENNNIVIISGEPGIGKTILAEMILYTGLSNGYLPVVIRSDLREGRTFYNKGLKQLFYYDDFLGQTFLRERYGFLLRNEDSSLVDFLEMINELQKAKLVMTTREHILSNALLGSERLRRSPLLDHKCVLQINDYSHSARARILYNHIYFSELPEDYRKVLIDEKFYEKIIEHRNFNPRLIEWLSSYRRVREIEPENFRAFIMGIMSNPQEIWHEAFQRQISDYARAVLLALFTFGGKVELHALEPGWSQLSSFEARKYNYPLSREGFEGALKEIEGSFVTITKGSVEFLNPSVKDFISGEIIARAERLSDLVQTSQRFEQLVTLWRWSRQSEARGPLAIISAASEQFVSAVEASIGRPYRRVTTFQEYSVEQRLDLYPEERLAALLEMSNDLESDRLLALAPSAVKSILERWDETAPDFERTAEILKFMEDDTFGRARLDRSLYDSIRNRMLAELTNAYSFRDFVYVDEFLKTTFTSPSDDEKEAYAVGFDTYIKSHFSNDLWEITSSGEVLDDMAEFMSRMMKEDGHDTSRQCERIEEAIAELNEREERRANNDEGHWKDNRSFERADKEGISNMFDSLR